MSTHTSDDRTPRIVPIYVKTADDNTHRILLTDFCPEDGSTNTMAGRFILPFNHALTGTAKFGYVRDFEMDRFPFDIYFEGPGARFGRFISPRHIKFEYEVRS